MAGPRIEAAGGTLPSPLFSAAENASLALADDLVAHVKADAGLLEGARAHLGDAGVQELVLVTGVYMFVCRYLETFEIELEEKEIQGSGLEEIRRSMENHD